VRSRGFNFRTALLVGTGPKAAQFGDFLEGHPHWGFRVIGYLDDDGGEIALRNRWPCLGRITDMETVLSSEVVDEVIFVIEKGKLGEYEEALLVAERHGVRAHVSLDIFPHVLARPVLEELDGIPLLTFTTTPSNPAELATKRAIDLVLALALFLVTLPVQMLAALAILLGSGGGPVLFRQVRCGLNGRLFTLLKFRTMEPGAEDRLTEISHLNEMTGPVFKVRRDPRLTPVGKLLRRLSIDELPQLWNVIAGNMSLVGPRPPLPEEVSRYEPWQRRRLSMKPGLTCLWQVSGRSELDFDRWMALDLKYIDTWSPLLDLKILLKTVPAVLSGRGAR
jgi:exopolysaccharide biosynthesis polyprenyl glycosylphosphotransferase